MKQIKSNSSPSYRRMESSWLILDNLVIDFDEMDKKLSELFG